jgi:hypothetical protein
MTCVALGRIRLHDDIEQYRLLSERLLLVQRSGGSRLRP